MIMKKNGFQRVFSALANQIEGTKLKFYDEYLDVKDILQKNQQLNDILSIYAIYIFQR